MPNALITGGTRGIGYAVAKRLAKENYELTLTYVTNREAAYAAKVSLIEIGAPEVHLICADSTKEAAIAYLGEAVRSLNITIDALVFNAGITRRESFEDMTLQSWQDVFFANVHFPTFFLQRYFDLLAPGASVTFTGSLMGVHPHGTALSYGVTKSAVHALVKNLVKFLSPKGIRINAVAPGFVDTEWQKDKPAEIRASIESKIALGRFCEPSELADVYWLLISNGYINGEIITVDGGYSYR